MGLLLVNVKEKVCDYLSSPVMLESAVTLPVNIKRIHFVFVEEINCLTLQVKIMYRPYYINV